MSLLASSVKSWSFIVHSRNFNKLTSSQHMVRLNLSQKTRNFHQITSNTSIFSRCVIHSRRCYSSKPTNAYEVLQVSPNATQDEIKKAFYRLAFDHHPDRKQDSDNSDTFILVTNAYEILSNPSRRTLYDIERKRGIDPLFSPSRDAPNQRDNPFDPWHKPEYEVQWEQFDGFNKRNTGSGKPWRGGIRYSGPDPTLSQEQVKERDKPIFALLGMFVFAAIFLMVSQIGRARKLMSESLDIKSREANLYLSQAVLKSRQGGKGFLEKEIVEAREKKRLAAETKD